METETLLLKDSFLSFLRWIIGLSIGSLSGLMLAVAGNTKTLKRGLLETSLNYLRAIPIIGLIPFIQLHFGVNEYGKIGLISWAVMFPVWLTVRTALRRQLIESELMLKGIRINRWKFRRTYLFPKIMSGYLHGVEIGIGIAWLSVVAAEWIGTYTIGFWSGGLGYRLVISYENNNWFIMNMILCIFGFLGVLTSLGWLHLINLVFRRFFNGFDPLRSSIKRASEYS